MFGSKYKIKNISAREILDSRGQPTVECQVVLNNGSKATSSVPSGASVGKYEALELRDRDSARYQGKGVLKAVGNIESIIAPLLVGRDVRQQEEVDKIIIKADNTDNKANLGSNTILAVSLAVARSASQVQGLDLYVWLEKLLGKVESAKNLAPKLSNNLTVTPAFNLINGGQHADNNLDIQEFWFLPAGALSLAQAIMMASEAYYALIKLAKSKGLNVNVGDEGGIAPKLANNQEALDLMQTAAGLAGFKAEEDYVLGLDAAASSFYADGRYKFEGQKITSQGLAEVYEEWFKNYPIKIFEDPFAEEDWQAWQEFTKQAGDKLSIVGDDLLVTNPRRLKLGIERKAANAILIKLNQIGTVSETLETVRLAQTNGWQTVISHRSGETNDDFIADLAIGVRASAIKSGAPARGERVAKYNRLMKIAENYSY